MVTYTDISHRLCCLLGLEYKELSFMRDDFSVRLSKMYVTSVSYMGHSDIRDYLTRSQAVPYIRSLLYNRIQVVAGDLTVQGKSHQSNTTESAKSNQLWRVFYIADWFSRFQLQNTSRINDKKTAYLTECNCYHILFIHYPGKIL